MRKAAAVSLFSAAVLLLEITYTRLLSVSHWHNFAFLVISTALLGFGLSGALLSALGERLKRHAESAPALFALLFGVSAPCALASGGAIGFDEVLFSFEPRQLLVFFVFYIIYAAPFFFAGCAIGSLICTEAVRVGPIYAANLCGSGAGCLLIFFLLPPLGGVKIVFLCGIAGMMSAILLATGRGGHARWAMLLLAIGSALLLVALPSPLGLRISPFKALRHYLSLPDGELLETRWNAISRIDVVSSRFIRIPPAGLSLDFEGDIPPQIALTSDADSPSPITRFCSRRRAEGRGRAHGGRPGHEKGAPAGETLSFADAVVQALPYRLGRTGRVLVIGAGGGLDCLTALSSRVERMDALEINPDVIDCLESRFARFSCGLFERTGVNLIQAEGRNWIRHGGRSYDVIQIPLLDSVAASSAGVHAFSENYLYTVESFRDCLRRLTPRGILCVTRWIKYPPRDCLRLLALGMAALEREGARTPPDHLALLRSWSTTALLVSRAPFSDEEIGKTREFCDEMDFDPVYFPGIVEDEANTHNVIRGAPYFRLASRLISDPEGFRRSYLFDVSAPTDDRPFFYHFLTSRAIPYLWKSMGTEWVPFAEWGELVIVAALVQSGFVSASLALLPLCLPAVGGARASGGRGVLLLYFFLLGLAFIAVEISFMQRFVLFLGHPTYAMSVVLFSLLLFAGLGSRMSSRLGRPSTIGLLALLLLVYTIGLPPLLGSLLGLPRAGRIAAAVLLISFPATLMGTAFPLGIRITHLRSPGLIPWAWAVNGSSSVFGAIAAVFMALYTSFTMILALAALFYALAFLLLLLPRIRY